MHNINMKKKLKDNAEGRSQHFADHMEAIQGRIAKLDCDFSLLMTALRSLLPDLDKLAKKVLEISEWMASRS